mmetsp:Transcript_247/g.431  ORF Transcript_247/g.431 Transcript_247/m.431 type:complete len:638 (+) Transcript_247:134-2047(+)
MIFLRHGRSFTAGKTILTHRPAASVLLPALSSGSSFSPSTTYRRHQYRHHNQGAAFQNANLFSAAASVIAASGALLGGSLICQCEANVAPETPMNEENDAELPTYTMAQVSKNDGKGTDNRVWMTYGGCVYDVTDFIANHPGGSEKISLAAGGSIEPHWHLYRQHFASDLPLQLMEKMLIGYLHSDDQEKVDDAMEQLANDPYEHEPSRSSLLKVHGDTPMNAEVPMDILGREYITPVDMFYIRHHHPVPLLSEKEVEDFRLDVDLTILSKATPASGNGDEKKQKQTAKLSLAQIKSLPKVEVTTTLQCSGNRRSGFNDFRRTSGTPWGQGAISTAKWGGARLVDVLMLASDQLADDEKGSKPENDATSTSTSNDKGSLLQTLQNLQTILDEHPNLQHLRFESIDGMLASIDILKALSPFGDVIIAYDMNDEPLPRDHGYPLRVIVPGYAAVRNVKWLSKLELAEEQAEGAWQRGLNYKVLPPSVVDANEVDLDKMPGLAEVSTFSGITNVRRVDEDVGEEKKMVPGETVMVKASGWAWAGGGRNIVRVDITGNNGKSWSNGNLAQGSNQPYGRAWAWVFWECPAIPAVVGEDGISVELSCKAVDLAFNSQPASSDGMWNVRGLANNSWFRLRHRVV